MREIEVLAAPSSSALQNSYFERAILPDGAAVVTFLNVSRFFALIDHVTDFTQL